MKKSREGNYKSNKVLLVFLADIKRLIDAYPKIFKMYNNKITN